MIRLHGYAESGGSLALAYGDQHIRHLMAYLGTEVSHEITLAHGALRPFARLEVGANLAGYSDADMHYVGDDTNYRFGIRRAASSHWTLSLGAELLSRDALTASLMIERTQAANAGYANSIRLHVSMAL